MTSPLIVGLGNPGGRYAVTRHNVGSMVAQRLAEEHGAHFEPHSRIPALIAEWKDRSIHWRVIQPVTFMNRSGEAVAAALNFWKLDLPSLLVVVDDVEIPPGALRLREHGSAGGHNGLKSLIDRLGGREFCRLRVGIGRPPRETAIALADWLLQPFEKSELPWLAESIKKAASAVECWALEGPATAMERYNAKAQPPVL